MPEGRRPRSFSIAAALLLAAVIHFDWHLARPNHHRLSLDWDYHWLVAIPVFALLAWWLSTRYPDRLWRASALNLLGGAFAAQILEPLGEQIGYLHRIAIDTTPLRWAVFAEFMAAGLMTYLAVLALRERRMAGGPTDR